MNDRQLKELILAAKGKLPFDIYFYNARIVDVYRERIIDSGSVGIKNGIIAAVCPDFEPRATEFIDCRGMYLAPFFYRRSYAHRVLKAHFFCILRGRSATRNGLCIL